MKGTIAPRILAVPLFAALAITPAVTQEGLFSFWSLWGVPLLASAAVFAVLAGMVLGSRALAARYAGRRVAAGEDGEANGEPAADEDGDANGEPATGEDRMANGEPAAGEEPAEVEPAAQAGEEEEREAEVSLGDALSELAPENFMDLARALQEMGRDADTLEVLARVVEGRESEHGDEVAEALRRLRRKLDQESSASA